MQKLDHKSLIYGIIVTQERVLVKQRKRAIRVRATEVLLYGKTKSGVAWIVVGRSACDALQFHGQ